jgi:L-lactate dehydrogenase complex protein LldG
MFEIFKTRAEAISAEVHRFGTRAKALDFIVQFMQKEGVADSPGSYAVWAGSPFLNKTDRNVLASKVPGLKFEVTRDTAREAKIGITQADYGVADTGSLAQDQTAVEQRLASSLSLINIVLIATDRILADLPSLMTTMHPNASNYIALITGPSKTADIERVLAIGVHGPERLVIVCVDELGGMN